MPTNFGRVAPTIYVSDLSRAVMFWTDQLGFHVTFTNGDPIVVAVVRRDAAELHLSLNPARAGNGHCHIMVDGITDLFAELVAKGATIKQPLMTQPWGLQDILTADPDGDTIEIAEPIVPSASA